MTFTHLYASRTNWKQGSFDPLLRAVASDETANAMISDPDLLRIYHPYDGGADVLLTSAAERDELRNRHRAWLSAHPSGL